MWVTKLLISPGKIRIFCPKLAFLFILGQALPAHLVPCWWIGWWLWRVGCTSQDTYLLYNIFSAITTIHYVKCESSPKSEQEWKILLMLTRSVQTHLMQSDLEGKYIFFTRCHPELLFANSEQRFFSVSINGEYHSHYDCDYHTTSLHHLTCSRHQGRGDWRISFGFPATFDPSLNFQFC